MQDALERVVHRRCRGARPGRDRANMSVVRQKVYINYNRVTSLTESEFDSNAVETCLKFEQRSRGIGFAGEDGDTPEFSTGLYPIPWISRRSWPAASHGSTGSSRSLFTGSTTSDAINS